MRALPPIERFFGEVRAGDGPFGLLGVSPDACTDVAVREALARRMERLASHPHGRSPEADEVRLALHVAAAQLLDPAVRAELIHDSRAAKSAATGPASPKPLITHEPFEDAALWAIKASGGWNPEAKRRLGALAHAYRVDREAFHASVRRVADRVSARSKPPAKAAESPALPAGTAAALDARILESRIRAAETRRRFRWLMLLLLLIMVSGSMLMARGVVVIRRLAIQMDAGIDQYDDETLEEARAAAPLTPESESVSVPPSVKPREDVAAAPPPADEIVQPPRANVAAAKQWAIASERLIRRDEEAKPDVLLGRAVRIAIVNLAAQQLWNSKVEESKATMNEALIEPYVPLALDGAGAIAESLTAPGELDRGKVALQLLDMKRLSGQALESMRNRRFLRELLGPADCDVAAETALFGPTTEIRLLARQIVLDQRQNPVMIYALLEVCSKAPKHDSTTELIAEVTERELPSVQSPLWSARVRAVLLERLVEMLAPTLEPAADRLAVRLEQIYKEMTVDVGSSIAEMPVSAGDTYDSSGVVDAAVLAWRAWYERASAYRAGRSFVMKLESIERQRDVRRSIARGPVQRFVAEQASISEIFALVVSEEQPGTAADVEQVLEDSMRERHEASHVYEQIEATERAILKLWLIRLGHADRVREDQS